MSPLKFCFESGQTTPPARPPRQYKKRIKDAPNVELTALSKVVPSKERKNCSVASPLAIENSPEPEFNIIVEDPTIPKTQRKFVPYIPKSRQTWIAPPVEGEQAPATVSSFSISPAAENEKIPPPQAVGSMRTPPKNEPLSLPRLERTPSSGPQRPQRVHYHHYHNHYPRHDQSHPEDHRQDHRHIQHHPQHLHGGHQPHHHHHYHHYPRHQPHHHHHHPIPTAAVPSCLQRAPVVPAHGGACNAPQPESADRPRRQRLVGPAYRPDARALRARLQSAARIVALPRLPGGVRVIARPGEWQPDVVPDVRPVATTTATTAANAAAPEPATSTRGVGADSGVRADSGAASSSARPIIVQVEGAVAPPTTRSAERRRPLIAQPEVQAAPVSPPTHSAHVAPVIQRQAEAAVAPPTRPTSPPAPSMPAAPVMQPIPALPQRTFWGTVL